MKMTLLLALFAPSFAFASYDLATEGTRIVCSGEDNYTIVLNKKRTTVQLTVEGESNGPQKIIVKDTDKKTYVTYKTEELLLTLSNDGDSFLYDGDQEASPIECK